MKKINSKLELCSLALDYEEAGNIIQRACEWQLLGKLFEVVEFFCPSLEEEEVADFVENYGAYAILVVPFTVEAAIKNVAKAMFLEEVIKRIREELDRL